MSFLGDVTHLGGVSLRPHDVDVSTTPRPGRVDRGHRLAAAPGGLRGAPQRAHRGRRRRAAWCSRVPRPAASTSREGSTVWVTAAAGRGRRTVACASAAEGRPPRPRGEVPAGARPPAQRLPCTCDHHDDRRRALGGGRDLRRRGSRDRHRQAALGRPAVGSRRSGSCCPSSQEVGDRWEAGTLSVAHEHFASDMLRRKLWALSSVPPQRLRDDDDRGVAGRAARLPAGRAARHGAAVRRADAARARDARALPRGGHPRRRRSSPRPALPVRTPWCCPRRGRRPSPPTPRALRRLAQDHPLYVAGRGADAERGRDRRDRAARRPRPRRAVFLVGALSRLSGSW